MKHILFYINMKVTEHLASIKYKISKKSDQYSITFMILVYICSVKVQYRPPVEVK
jgi:hypothetical protein